VKLISDLLGMAVLTAPLWITAILLLLAIAIAGIVATRIKRVPIKILTGLGIFLAVFFLPFADEITGRLYFERLCHTEAGVKVYHTVDLPGEYWDELGRPKFYDEKNGNFSLAGYSTEYTTGIYISSLHIDNAGYKRIDSSTSKVLGEVTNFRYWGGWIRRNMTSNNIAASCPGGLDRSNSLVMQIFKQSAR